VADEPELLYRNPLAQPEDVAGFRLEGEGTATFPRGRLRLESTRPAADGQAANVVLWCPVELTGDLEISWSFWPVHEPGLCILFFHARGRDGRDLFDPGLADRFGPYEQYHSGDIDAYHLSYFRRRWQSERRFHTCNLRKSYGFHLVAQGADPLPSVLDADGPYRLRLRVVAGRITFTVDDLAVLDWSDDGSVGGRALTGGKIGLRADGADDRGVRRPARHAPLNRQLAHFARLSTGPPRIGQDGCMGRDVEYTQFTRADRTRYRLKVQQGLDALARMLTESRFDAENPQVGLEIELNLVDCDNEPAMRNAEVLDVIADSNFQTELGRFNIEINVPPRRLAGGGLTSFEDSVRAALNDAAAKAETVDTHLAMIGILPTLRPEHVREDAVSANPRYALLEQQIFAARGEDLEISIDGVERLEMTSDTIMPEAACTSTQVHLQVSPDEFASYWNAAQAIAGIQLAVGANSPFLFGRQLVSESRIPLFEQSTDTRSEDLKAQGVRPRVWFGERWITSIFDLFEENSRYFNALLPIVSDDDPIAVLDAGGVPTLDDMRLHNGTVYRWNRPVYDVAASPSGDRQPHLRVENRVLPAGPTVVDTMANTAFFAGLVRDLAQADRPIWSQMSFQAAEENFAAGVRDGIGASVYWPRIGQVSAAELVVRKLLPLAADGLRDWGVDSAEIDRLLGVIEQRCIHATNGSTWQTAEVVAREAAGATRDQALHGMLGAYLDRMHSNEPVHTWSVGS